MLVIPKMLELHFPINDSLTYGWNDRTCQEFYHEYVNEKLSYSLWGLNHKSTVGLATALAEWILWRLSTAKDHKFSAAISTLEPMWAEQVDKLYIAEWLYQGPTENDVVKGPLWVTLRCMNDVRFNYIKGKIFINAKVSTLAGLARYITSNTEFFDNWLTNQLKKATKLFPAEYDRNEYEEIDEYYDSSHELPIPREFYFEPEFNYKETDIDQLLADFISSLDYQENNFLNPPEIMIKNGYQGIPYQYSGK